LTVEGRPLHYLASWMFVLEGEVGQQAFRAALTEVISTFDEAPRWPGYDRFLAHYYAPNRRWGGYTQPMSPEDRERKLRCSWAEHRLSLRLAQQGRGVHQTFEAFAQQRRGGPAQVGGTALLARRAPARPGPQLRHPRRRVPSESPWRPDAVQPVARMPARGVRERSATCLR
jgi:hypothetical protein